MLAKNKHTKANYVSRLLVLPLASVIFVGISCKVDTENKIKTEPDEIVATAPLNEQSKLVDDSGSAVYYNNKKVTGLDVSVRQDKSVYVKLTFEDGSREDISMAVAEKAGLPVPPPPPPPSAFKQVYKGKTVN